MMTDLRTLIHRMADELDRYRLILHDDRSPYHPLAVEARAALAQQEPQPVADGEVGEHVRWLNFEAEQALKAGRYFPAEMLTRAAELLAQQHPQPIPVSERLPWPEDCDAEGRVWWLGVETWMLRTYAVVAGAAIPLGTYWLPGRALPLPTTTENTDG